MDIIVKKQETSDVIICVPLVINTGAPDTAATVTVTAINPDGTQNTTFTAPSITEVIASSGVYRLTFSTAAATKLFTQEDTANPYTLLIKTATSGSTGYRAVRVYCSTKMPGEYAKTTDVTTVGTSVSDIPTLAEIEASTVLAKAATVATAASLATLPTLTQIEASTVLAKASAVSALPSLAAIEASTVLAKSATTSSLTLSQIEASTVIGKQDSLDTLLTFIRNKKVLRKEGAVWYLCIRNSADNLDILKKALKDSTGADITDIAAGVITQELLTSV